MKTRPTFDRLHGHPYRNIFVAMLIVVFGNALSPHLIGRLHVSDLVISALIAAAVFETVRNRRHAVIALVLGLPAIASRLAASALPDTPTFNGAVLFLSAVFFGYLIWNILSDILSERRSTSERIYGALCAYILIGVLFALLYAHLEFRDPSSAAFTSSNPGLVDTAEGESGLLPLFSYYSFVTLTTLGYGDITPVTQAARTLAWLEALVGQLYLVVMVAGFVAMHVSSARTVGLPGDDGGGGGGEG
jgi:hypothetical protein